LDRLGREVEEATATAMLFFYFGNQNFCDEEIDEVLQYTARRLNFELQNLTIGLFIWNPYFIFMPKLYFRHGAVSSAKTLNLLAVAHNYRNQGKHCILMKPEMDIRFGTELIKSRSGLEKDADVLINQDTNLLALPEAMRSPLHCVLVDECQFLAVKHIEQLREITLLWNVPVICYGLRTDFRTRLFPASQRLMELADSIEEVKTTCYKCNRKAVLNLKHVNGKADVSGPAVQLGAEEKYFPCCFPCYRSSILDSSESLPFEI
jgi:thymidine kinase